MFRAPNFMSSFEGFVLVKIGNILFHFQVHIKRFAKQIHARPISKSLPKSSNPMTNNFGHQYIGRCRSTD